MSCTPLETNPIESKHVRVTYAELVNQSEFEGAVDHVQRQAEDDLEHDVEDDVVGAVVHELGLHRA